MPISFPSKGGMPIRNKGGMPISFRAKMRKTRASTVGMNARAFSITHAYAHVR